MCSIKLGYRDGHTCPHGTWKGSTSKNFVSAMFLTSISINVILHHRWGTGLFDFRLTLTTTETIIDIVENWAGM